MVKAESVIQIGELSRRTGCNIETIRYYERIGLLPAPPRSAGHYRVYDLDHVRRLKFIRTSRDLRFSLVEVRALLALADRKGGSCEDVQKLAQTHLNDVQSKIADLKAIDRVLRKTVALCASGSRAVCPIIEALSGD